MKFARPLAVSGTVTCLFLAACATSASAPQLTYGVVSSASPEATAAGVEILERGGNAIDAAAAVQFALGVTEPAMSGLGGQTQIVLQKPGEPAIVINGTSFAPAGIPDVVAEQDLKTSYSATTVPSTVKVMDFAMRNYGSGNVSWADTLAPAIRYADAGFVIGSFRARVYSRHETDVRANQTVARLFLNPDGTLPQLGDVLRQPVLAATLRRLAEAGADDFYTGEIAAKIAEDMAANGGWITLEDLASTPDPVVMAPLTTSYRGFEVSTLPPPAGGWVVLQALNLLEQTQAEDLDEADATRAAALLVALDIAHTSRAENPELDLVSFGADMSHRIDKATAVALLEDRDHGETTHFSVVDKDGMAVSVTSSIDSYFGSRAASPELGFLYNNYMQTFELAPGETFSLASHAMPYSSMSTSIVSKDGQPVLVLGSPGSARIISAVTQVISHWVDVDEGIETAVAAPRVHVVIDRKDGRDNAYVEQMVEGLDVDALGFDLANPQTDLIQNGLNAYFGGVHAIALEEGGWRGAADPRRDGTVGYAGDR
ncbi:gamma-glutamyltransferase [Hyphomonas adhaerens MHS-3]|uniref:Gamma-glutamyltransferase n=1 Tax=Hyphomonas adhaerens MHS-3 TaxID=1280949 RepID=A0A069E4M7_9PROT|nr:gamma-glutamyltransferase [Hyphomonas adhaerens]KCZ85038.1 gamma-glutamyltransferase [Hyphomonas adhaerens MHS-3]